jgi:hypothetical protein
MSYAGSGDILEAAPIGGSARVLSNLLPLSVTVPVPVAPGSFLSPRRRVAGAAPAW